jgi:hypothetical protein
MFSGTHRLGAGGHLSVFERLCQTSRRAGVPAVARLRENVLGFLGVTLPELVLVAVLVALVLLAPIAPRLGERIGGLFDKK